MAITFSFLAPGPVSLLRVQEDILSVQLEWEPPMDGEGRGYVTEYEIRYRRESSSNYLNIDRVSGETMSYRVTGLLPGDKYVFEVIPSIELLSGPERTATTSTNMIGELVMFEKCVMCVFINFYHMIRSSARSQSDHPEQHGC